MHGVEAAAPAAAGGKDVAIPVAPAADAEAMELATRPGIKRPIGLRNLPMRVNDADDPNAIRGYTESKARGSVSDSEAQASYAELAAQQTTVDPNHLRFILKPVSPADQSKFDEKVHVLHSFNAALVEQSYGSYVYFYETESDAKGDSKSPANEGFKSYTIVRESTPAETFARLTQLKESGRQLFHIDLMTYAALHGRNSIQGSVIAVPVAKRLSTVEAKEHRSSIEIQTLNTALDLRRKVEQNSWNKWAIGHAAVSSFFAGAAYVTAPAPIISIPCAALSAGFGALGVRAATREVVVDQKAERTTVKTDHDTALGTTLITIAAVGAGVASWFFRDRMPQTTAVINGIGAQSLTTSNPDLQAGAIAAAAATIFQSGASLLAYAAKKLSL